MKISSIVFWFIAEVHYSEELQIGVMYVAEEWVLTTLAITEIAQSQRSPDRQ